jgi:hypothetical protein
VLTSKFRDIWEILLKALRSEPDAIPKASAGASNPSTIAATVMSMLSGPAYTKAIADNPEIRLKQVLQNP